MSIAADPLLAITKLYHFTDVRNLPLIKKLGGLWATAILKKGNTEFFPGGNQWSLDQDVSTGVDYYVHLCWDRNHHMEKNIRDRDKDIKPSTWRSTGSSCTRREYSSRRTSRTARASRGTPCRKRSLVR